MATTIIQPAEEHDPVVLSPGEGLRVARLWADDATPFGLGPAPDDADQYQAWVLDVAKAIEDRAAETNVRPVDVKDLQISLADADERQNYIVTLAWDAPDRQLTAAFEVATFLDSRKRQVVKICKDGVVQYADKVWRVVAPIRMIPHLPQFWFGRGDALRMLHGEEVGVRIGEFWTTRNLSEVVEKAVTAVQDLLKATRLEFLNAARDRSEAIKLQERQLIWDWTVLNQGHRQFLNSPLELGRLVVSVRKDTPQSEVDAISEVVARLFLKVPANRTKKMGIVSVETRAGSGVGTRLGPRRSEVGAPWFTIPVLPSNHVCYVVDWTIEE